jgi:hypothetical protein
MGTHNKTLVTWILSAFLVVLITACGSDQGSNSSSQTGGQTSNQQPSGPSIVGTWSGQCTTLNLTLNPAEFRDDGTVLFNTLVAKYSVNGNQLQLSANGYTVEYSYMISQSGNILELSDAKGNFCAVGRVGTNAVQQATQALIGKWTNGQNCSMSGPFQYFQSFDMTPHLDVSFVYANSSSGQEMAAAYKDRIAFRVPDAGTVVTYDTSNGVSVTQTSFAFWVSGTTLLMEYFDSSSGSAGSPCSYQKSA